MSSDFPALPSGWTFESLDSCCKNGSVTYGIVQPGMPVNKGVPFIRVNNFQDTRLDLTDVMRVAPEIAARYERTRLLGGEVLVTVVGTVGQVVVVPKSMFGYNVARAVAVLHPLPHVSAEWLALCLRSPYSKHRLSSRANTTVQTTINLKDLRALPIPLPPVNERNAITKLIGSVDESIALLRETNTALEAFAQTLFRSWFINFDPVHAKLAGNAPEAMSAELAALFPSEFEDSELGLIPKGWVVGRISDIGQNSRTQGRPSNIPPTTPYIGLEHMPRRSLSITEWGSAATVESGKFWFNSSDILFGKLRPYFHKVCIANVAGVCSTDILVVQPSEPNWHAFLVMHLFSDAFIENATQLSDGARMPRTNWRDTAAYKVSLPPAELAESLNKLVQPMFSLMGSNIGTIRALASLRDHLLPRLISGKLRIEDAEASVAAITSGVDPELEPG